MSKHIPTINKKLVILKKFCIFVKQIINKRNDK